MSVSWLLRHVFGNRDLHFGIRVVYTEKIVGAANQVRSEGQRDQNNHGKPRECENALVFSGLYTVSFLVFLRFLFLIAFRAGGACTGRAFFHTLWCAAAGIALQVLQFVCVIELIFGKIQLGIRANSGCAVSRPSGQ